MRPRWQGQFSSVSQSSPTLCDPMNRSTPGLPIHHQLPELSQILPRFLQDHFLALKWYLNQNTIKCSFIILNFVMEQPQYKCVDIPREEYFQLREALQSMWQTHWAENKSERARGSGLYWMCLMYQVFVYIVAKGKQRWRPHSSGKKE